MKLHEDCEGRCQLNEHKGYVKCEAGECELLRWTLEDDHWRNMSDQERRGWMRARDMEVD